MAEKWYCFKDKVEMVAAEPVLFYLSITDVINGLKCPQCGVIYLDEETVVGKLIPAEQAIEDK
ncbi:MAG: hypothetical protein WA151_17055 [Desulfatirhabdiaceae bacterium]